jgi:hypothetical protein
MSFLERAAALPRRTLLLAGLIVVWAVIAAAQFGSVAKDAVDLHDTLDSLTPAERATFWNGPAEPFGRYAAGYLPQDATVVFVDMSDPDTNITSFYLYPRTMLRATSSDLGELTPGTYLVYFTKAAEGTGVSLAQADIEALVRERGLLSEVNTYEAPDGTVGVILKVVG